MQYTFIASTIFWQFAGHLKYDFFQGFALGFIKLYVFGCSGKDMTYQGEYINFLIVFSQYLLDLAYI